MPQVELAVNTLEKRLRRAQIQRLILLWFTVALFVFVGILFTTFRANQIRGCERGSETAAIQSQIAERIGAHEAARQAHERATLDCSKAYSWF